MFSLVFNIVGVKESVCFGFYFYILKFIFVFMVREFVVGNIFNVERII